MEEPATASPTSREDTADDIAHHEPLSSFEHTAVRIGPIVYMVS